MPPPPRNGESDGLGWRYRIESELAKVRAILEERGPRRDQWERECGTRFSEIERRLGVVELLCKGSSESNSVLGKLSALIRDPAALIIVFLVISMLINAGISPQDLLAGLSG